jgi:hypothetical protein
MIGLEIALVAVSLLALILFYAWLVAGANVRDAKLDLKFCKEQRDEWKAECLEAEAQIPRRDPVTHKYVKRGQ